MGMTIDLEKMIEVAIKLCQYAQNDPINAKEHLENLEDNLVTIKAYYLPK